MTMPIHWLKIFEAAALVLIFAQFVRAQDYYYSPTGNDTAAGTITAPRKTLVHAAANMRAGDTAIFLDGTYNETESVSFRTAGTASQRIVFKSQNKHGAKIVFQSDGDTGSAAHWSISAPYITVDGFDLRPTVKGSKSSEVTLRAWGPGGNNAIFRNNLIRDSWIGIKINADNVLVEGNIINSGAGGTDSGVDVYGSLNSIFRNNEFVMNSGIGLYTKGGTRNAQVYNNTVRITGAAFIGLACGGWADGTTGVFDRMGWEAYNSAFFNNVIVVNAGAALQVGMNIVGGNACGLFNNVVVNAVRGAHVEASNSASDMNGWLHLTTPQNPKIKNNIFMDCGRGIEVKSAAGTQDYSHNTFFNVPQHVIGTNNLTSDPKLVNKLSDWHLQHDSPAIGAGIVVSHTWHTGSPSPSAIYLTQDKDGVLRANPWSMGIYAHNGPGGADLTPPAPPTGLREK